MPKPFTEHWLYVFLWNWVILTLVDYQTWPNAQDECWLAHNNPVIQDPDETTTDTLIRYVPIIHKRASRLSRNPNSRHPTKWYAQHLTIFEVAQDCNGMCPTQNQLRKDAISNWAARGLNMKHMQARHWFTGTGSVWLTDHILTWFEGKRNHLRISARDSYSPITAWSESSNLLGV